MNTKFSRRIRLYKEGYISVHVFLHQQTNGKRYYDTVVYRKIKDGNGGFKHVRGANLKPSDIPVVIKLLGEANDFLKAEVVSENL